MEMDYNLRKEWAQCMEGYRMFPMKNNGICCHGCKMNRMIKDTEIMTYYPANTK